MTTSSLALHTLFLSVQMFKLSLLLLSLAWIGTLLSSCSHNHSCLHPSRCIFTEDGNWWTNGCIETRSSPAFPNRPSTTNYARLLYHFWQFGGHAIVVAPFCYLVVRVSAYALPLKVRASIIFDSNIERDAISYDRSIKANWWNGY